MSVAEKQELVSTEQENVTGMVAMIERLARAPEVDVTKLEKMLDMQERIMDREAKAAYTAALSKMQPELPVIAERGKSNNGKYALWEDINDAIKPVLAENGFALSFRTGQEGDKIVVTGVLSHEGGHSEETTMHLPADTSGSKNAVQAVGSSTSYGKRYTAQALLNLTSRDGGERDDDGDAGGANTVTGEQLDELTNLADELGIDKVRFCKMHKVASLSMIRQQHFAEAKKAMHKAAEMQKSTQGKGASK